MFDFFVFVILNFNINFVPLEEIFIGAPPPSVSLISFPQDNDLTGRILAFARTRPYADDVQAWWNDSAVSTEFICQKVQELEYEYKTLPEAIGSDKFAITNRQIYDRLEEWNEYKMQLKAESQFMLRDDQDFVEELIKQIENYADGYRYLSYARDNTYGQMLKRRYLLAVKQKIGDKFYDEGVLPRLIPDVVKNSR